MSGRELTIWEQARLQGYLAPRFPAVLQLDGSRRRHRGLGRRCQVVQALETKPRLPVVWFHFQECTCCSESFIRSSHPIVSDIMLDKISLDYTETLQAAAGHQAEAALHDTMKKYKGEYLMLRRGLGADGGRRRLLLHRRPHGARHRQGSGRRRQGDRRVGQLRVQRLHPGREARIRPAPRRSTSSSPGKPIINVPGCPPIARGDGRHDRPPARLRPHPAARRPRPAEGVLLAARARHLLPPAELRRRPVRRVVRRRERAGAGTASTRWAAAGRSPTTPAASSRWNNGVSFPIQSGHGCIGCSEANFWDNGPFYQHLAAFPGFGIETTADTIGLAVGAATAGRHRGPRRHDQHPQAAA